MANQHSIRSEERTSSNFREGPDQEEGTSLLSDQQQSQQQHHHQPSLSYEDIEQEIDDDLTALEPSINPHRSLFYILLLTIIIGGLQLSWSVEFSQGTPFLLSLGMSKRTLALIWIAGPLSGSLGHPVIGMLSDLSLNPKGRRRNFIIVGCVSTVISLFALSYSIDIIKGLFFHGGNTEENDVKRATIPFAAFSIYFIDFSIAVIQASSRAYIVDNVPTHQQQLSNAFAAILIGGFNILGFFLGAIELPRFFPFLGSSQFKVLAAIACLTLGATTITSLWYIKERDPTTDPIMKLEREKTEVRLVELGLDSEAASTSFFQMMVFLYRQTINSVLRLSPQVKLVCLVEFCAWIGYFPMLFYTTTYVGELYKKEFWTARDPSLPALTEAELGLLDEEAVRRGSMALLAHSVVSFITDILLPLLTKPVKELQLMNNDNAVLQRIESLRQRYLPELTVRLTWIISHVVFILCMVSTVFIHSSSTAIAMFGVLGVSWGVALWSPFVLISEEVSRIKEVKVSIIHTNGTDVGPSTTQLGEIDEEAVLMKGKFEDYEHEPGIILGIHNFFVAAPQMISSLASSLLFAMLSTSPSDSDSHDSSSQFQYDNSIVWVFRLGGVAALFALWLSVKVKKDEELWGEVEALQQKGGNGNSGLARVIV
ncbi:hypothetical protein WICPIJ_004436 [Wickerhamomyces pijperi]|uniref:Sucrose transporter n=1 Tax=Wickerhamomyces pijperi TaxID=599730 RepID=A0A9P8TMX6_WICPI|nr:hypothetical protein WICPIJ_004436 [Wickerhamomyces pijperi]